MKLKVLFAIFILHSIYGFINFIPTWDFKPIVIKGKIINLKTGKPLKRTFIYLDEKEMDEIDFYPDNGLTNSNKTDNKGEFLFRNYYVDKSNLQFWLKIEEFAQLNIQIISLNSDTLDLDIVYFVPYENELEIEKHNMPITKGIKKAKYEKYSINEIDSIFRQSNNKYDMELNPIDTVTGLITRYNFGKGKPRGTTIKNYKQVTFRRTVNTTSKN